MSYSQTRTESWVSTTGDIPKLCSIDRKLKHKLCLGDVIKTYDDEYGVVRFISADQNDNNTFIGIEHLRPHKDGHDGRSGGLRYFKCKNKYGKLYLVDKIKEKVTPFELLFQLEQLKKQFTNLYASHTMNKSHVKQELLNRNRQSENSGSNSSENSDDNNNNDNNSIDNIKSNGNKNHKKNNDNNDSVDEAYSTRDTNPQIDMMDEDDDENVNKHKVGQHFNDQTIVERIDVDIDTHDHELPNNTSYQNLNVNNSMEVDNDNHSSGENTTGNIFHHQSQEDVVQN